MTVKTIIEKYGEPGAVKNLTTLFLPFDLIIAWNLEQKTNKMQIHKLAAPSFTKIANDLLNIYGLNDLNKLGINIFGGCYNNRPLRGTEERYNALIKAGLKTEAYKYLSLHSWALAVDLDPTRNKLNETSKTARFARPEYKPLIDTFYRYGWYSLGVEKNYDWQHFQFIKP
jgi:hypothetical protein